jgi:hypothetical protein
MTTLSIMMFAPLLLAASSPPSQAADAAPIPPAITAPASTFDAATRGEIVAKLSEAMRDRYVFPETGERAATRISAALAAGEYDGLADRTAFIQRLSADVRAIAEDKHLNIKSPTLIPPPSGPTAMPWNEAGVTRADRLAGGIGYIEVVGFPPLHLFKPAIDRAMSALKGSRALIVDVRRNGGGSPEAVAYLVSYLVEPGHPINTIVARVPKTRNFTRKDHSSVPTPVSFAAVPVYVLTSEKTFSGGEELAYDVQALRRGTIVGEITGGGANPTGPVDLGHGVMASIPFGRAENPITKTNWEGRGVQPDLAVAASNALEVALQRAGHKPFGEIEAASVERVFPRATPLPGHETAIRQLVAGFVSGQPDYSVMAPKFADQTRTKLSQLREGLAPLGELRMIKFLRPYMAGGDEFELTFANGTRRMAILLDPTGKIMAASPPMMVKPNQ